MNIKSFFSFIYRMCSIHVHIIRLKDNTLVDDNPSMHHSESTVMYARAYLRGGGFRGLKPPPPEIFRFFFEK